MKPSVSDAAVSSSNVDSINSSQPVVARRRATLLYVLALLAWLVLGVAMESTADSSSSGSETPSLQDILEKGLKARRPSEFKFVDRVCGAVTRGDIPRTLAQRTFLWARRRHSKHPFPYFQRAMEIQASQLGVTL